MKKLFSIAAVALLALLAVPTFGQQYTFTGTTLGSAITASQNQLSLAAVTGISGASTGNLTDIYVDKELMQVLTVNTTAKTVTVIRGVSGTQAAAHISGALVLAAAPPAFQNYDPEGSCTASSTPAQPWINTRTGNQWLCSSKTGEWVAGFGNSGTSGVGAGLSADVASANTILPSGPLFQTTGTVIMKTITVPTSVDQKKAFSITIIFTGSVAGLTWDATGNIAVAGTATTAGSSVTFTWNPATSKWSPSRLA